MSEQSLKRYGGANKFHLVVPCEGGPYVLAADVHALIEAALAIESGRGCDAGCASKRPGYVAGGISLDANTQPNAHEVKNKCNCAHGRVMALLK